MGQIVFKEPQPKVWKQDKDMKASELEGHDPVIGQFYVLYNENMYKSLISFFKSMGVPDLPGKTKEALKKEGDQEQTILQCSLSERYVLKGDFRKEYEEVIDKGWKACLTVYKKLAPKFNSDDSKGPEVVEKQ